MKRWSVWKSFAWGAALGCVYTGALMSVHSEWASPTAQVIGQLFGGGFFLGLIFGVAAAWRNYIVRGSIVGDAKPIKSKKWARRMSGTGW